VPFRLERLCLTQAATISTHRDSVDNAMVSDSVDNAMVSDSVDNAMVSLRAIISHDCFVFIVLAAAFSCISQKDLRCHHLRDDVL
jgi:hypothetical protein